MWMRAVTPTDRRELDDDMGNGNVNQIELENASVDTSDVRKTEK